LEKKFIVELLLTSLEDTGIEIIYPLHPVDSQYFSWQAVNLSDSMLGMLSLFLVLESYAMDLKKSDDKIDNCRHFHMLLRAMIRLLLLSMYVYT